MAKLLPPSQRRARDFQSYQEELVEHGIVFVVGVLIREVKTNTTNASVRRKAMRAFLDALDIAPNSQELPENATGIFAFTIRRARIDCADPRARRKWAAFAREAIDDITDQFVRANFRARLKRSRAQS